jgi:hypothetical protein
LDRLQTRQREAHLQLNNVKQLKDLLDQADDASRAKVRKQLRGSIRQLLKSIDVFPEGPGDRMLIYDDGIHQFKYISRRETWLDDLDAFGPDIEAECGKKEYEDTVKKVLSHIENEEIATTGKDQRCFTIWFETGGMRHVSFMGDGTAISIAGESDMDLLEDAMPFFIKEKNLREAHFAKIQ